MKTLKTIILLLLMAMSVRSFSQARFSKRKYMKGIFTEKHHRVKLPVSDQEITETPVSEKTRLAESSNAPVDTSAGIIPGILQNTIAVNEKITLLNIQPLDNLQSTAKNDAYRSIPKHNTTYVHDEKQYTNAGKLSHVDVIRHCSPTSREEHAVQFNQKTSKNISANHIRKREFIDFLREDVVAFLIFMLAFGIVGCGLTFFPLITGIVLIAGMLVLVILGIRALFNFFDIWTRTSFHP